MLSLCLNIISKGGGWRDALRQLAGRQPAYVWLSPLVFWCMLTCVVWIIEAGATWITGAVPVHPAILLLWCILSATFTIPQQCCLSLGTPILMMSLVNIGLLLQYLSATGLELFGRRWGLLLFGCPNLALTVYVIMLSVLHFFRLTSRFAMRQSCWTIYTFLAPSLLVPQTIFCLLVCPVDLGSRECTGQVFQSLGIFG